MNETLEIELERTWLDEATKGPIFIDDKFICFTIEDKIGLVKIANETAIPYGRFEVLYNYSPKFKMNMPLITGVPKLFRYSYSLGGNNRRYIRLRFSWKRVATK